ncbi:coiled-coil domain-containing protein 115-like [Diadema antillarum]|uniref:coiled-coil domain-containing protein 115-like n=1 Tax=Diadema antillarum TaxID=105358 RepID=UPI003A8A7A65
MDLAALCEELDELAVNYFQILEDLSEQRRRFEKFVREGFFNLSKARYSMGNRAVSAVQYDTNSMTPLAHVVTTDKGNHHSFEVVRTKPLSRSERKSVEGSESGSNQLMSDTKPDITATRRRKQTSPSQEDEIESLGTEMQNLKTSDQDDTRPRVPTDPLLWFGVLVPQPLRHGQQNFVNAVEACTSMASLQTKLDHAYALYRSKLREKHDALKQMTLEGKETVAAAGAISAGEGL